jgi:hypothetical protein
MDAHTPSGSSILLEEYYAAGNPAFLHELKGIRDPRKLAGFTDKWKNDPRPWAREMILEYLNAPLGNPGHNVVVKRLFKAAEAKKDAALMAAFLHAFDVLVRRRRRTRYKWDRQTRSAYNVEELYAPKDNLIAKSADRTGRNPATGEYIQFGRRLPKDGRLFSYRTRYYLRRRVWRFFRFLGYKDPAAFVAGVAAALTRYADDDLTKGEHILDSWCLLNACYRYSPPLAFTPSHAKLQDGASLNDLKPSPKHLKAWQSPEGARALWSLIAGGKSRLVRLWAMAMLKTHHPEFLATLTAEQLLPLFDSFDDETQQFAAQTLEAIPSLPSLPLATWLRLLEVENPGALALICDLMVKHVSADRLDLRQTITLAIANPAPVAALGLKFLQTKTIAPADREALSDLAKAQSKAVGGKIAAHALSILGTKEAYDVVLVSRFFDAVVPPIRQAAWVWLESDTGAAGYNDPALWARLLETPYEDVRLRLVKALQSRVGGAGGVKAADVDQLAPVWAAVLLGIHRGGRHKLIALNQISRALVAHPHHAPKLLPVMAVALRSVRPAEARAGLAAVVAAAQRNPALLETAGSILPELRFVSAGATA